MSMLSVERKFNHSIHNWMNIIGLFMHIYGPVTTIDSGPTLVTAAIYTKQVHLISIWLMSRLVYMCASLCCPFSKSHQVDFRRFLKFQTCFGFQTIFVNLHQPGSLFLLQSIYLSVCLFVCLFALNKHGGKTCSRHDDVIQWNHFSRYWPFLRGIHRGIPRTKASDAELWCFLWSAPEKTVE